MPGGRSSRRVGFGLPGFRVYVATVSIVGLGAAAFFLSRLQFSTLPHTGAAFWTVAILLLLAELRPLVTAGTAEENGITISTAFVFALLLHWGLPVAVALQMAATLLADLLRRRAAWRTLFNIGQYTLAWSTAALALALAGRLPGLGDPLRYTSADLPATVAAAVLYFVVNDALVATALSLHAEVPLASFYGRGMGQRAFTESALLALAPIIAVVLERGAALVPLLILPIIAVYAAASVSLQREHQAHHDALTGLPNRKLLQQRASAALANAVRNRGQAALILLDLDRFKEVNDTLGHATGDALLRLVASRLSAALRPGDTVARLGGDEFAVLLPVIRNANAATEVAQRMHRALGEPFHQGEATFEVDGSLGIAVCPEHGSDVVALLQRADVAMYLAKETGSGVEVYTPERDRHSVNKLGLFGELRRALGAGDLMLYFQPEVSLDSGAVTAVEALLRWQHPQQGVLLPEQFLGLAQTSGLMRQITRFVLDASLSQAASWRAAGMPSPVAVNVSARDLHDTRFVSEVAAALRAHGLGPGCLILEVTESLLMAEPERVGDSLRGLYELGVGVSLDDFGTGYSSLVHLRRLPVSQIKIDRSFVSRLDTNEDDAVIVRSIIELGGALGPHVVAEGVASAVVWAKLQEFGCPAAQGYYISKPLPGPVITARMRQHLNEVRLADGPPPIPAARARR